MLCIIIICMELSPSYIVTFFKKLRKSMHRMLPFGYKTEI